MLRERELEEQIAGMQANRRRSAVFRRSTAHIPKKIHLKLAQVKQQADFCAPKSGANPGRTADALRGEGQGAGRYR